MKDEKFTPPSPVCLSFFFVISMRVSSQNEALICTLWFDKDRLFVDRITVIIFL